MRTDAAIHPHHVRTPAGKTLRELRIAEVVQLDMQIGKNGKVEAYRAKVKVSFKFEGKERR